MLTGNEFHCASRQYIIFNFKSSLAVLVTFEFVFIIYKNLFVCRFTFIIFRVVLHFTQLSNTFMKVISQNVVYYIDTVMRIDPKWLLYLLRVAAYTKRHINTVIIRAFPGANKKPCKITRYALVVVVVVVLKTSHMSKKSKRMHRCTSTFDSHPTSTDMHIINEIIEPRTFSPCNF